MKNVKIAESGSSVKWVTLKWIGIINTDPDAFYVKDHLSEDQLFKRLPDDMLKAMLIAKCSKDFV